MNDDFTTHKFEPATGHTDAGMARDTAAAPAGTSMLRQAARAALLSLAAAPAPILIALVDRWLKTH
ncbi:hypothetical protein [Streptomyces sp. TLI_171]|uniref:hypothetical protein n=1 Tax=Streptomyces sp. TLI_171 TaxID=1938859 RepID=UPI000C1807C1|nr:hypothetical protein [Streptomyces sp. TLI_171]RKE19610.1 hypothetical protein BX266_2937 [Streptomyces sp. TLI_171]